MQEVHSRGSACTVPVVKVELQSLGGNRSQPSALGSGSRRLSIRGKCTKDDSQKAHPCFGGGVWGTGLVEAQRRLGLRAQSSKRPLSASRKCHTYKQASSVQAESTSFTSSSLALQKGKDQEAGKTLHEQEFDKPKEGIRVSGTWHGSRSELTSSASGISGQQDQVKQKKQLRAKQQARTEASHMEASCSECGKVLLADAIFCQTCGHKRQLPQQKGQDRVDEHQAGNGAHADPTNVLSVVHSVQKETTTADVHTESRAEGAEACQKRTSPESTLRSVPTMGINGKTPSIIERSEAWLEYRQMKLAWLKEKCDADVGSFSPRLHKPMRSPRWLAGPQGGGDLHERGMRSIARKTVGRQRHEEEQLAEDLRCCPFKPDLSSSLPFKISRKDGEAAAGTMKPIRAVVSLAAADTDRPCPNGQVTPERAALFYDRQRAWMEAKLEEQKQLREDAIFRTLQEESAARKRESSLRGRRVKSPLRGVLSRTVYDRQVAWLRQRECELEEMRQTHLEEVTGQKHAGRKSSSRTPTPRRPRSAPSTPRKTMDSPRSNGETAPRSIARWGHSQSAPSTPRCRHPREGDAASASASGAAIVQRLRNARLQSRQVDGQRSQCNSSPESTAPATPMRGRSGTAYRSVDELGLAHNRALCVRCGSAFMFDSLFCLQCGHPRQQDLHSCAKVSLDHTADFGWPDTHLTPKPASSVHIEQGTYTAGGIMGVSCR